jgi:hypothetical protein
MRARPKLAICRQLYIIDLIERERDDPLGRSFQLTARPKMRTGEPHLGNERAARSFGEESEAATTRPAAARCGPACGARSPGSSPDPRMSGLARRVSRGMCYSPRHHNCPGQQRQ